MGAGNELQRGIKELYIEKFRKSITLLKNIRKNKYRENFF